MVQEQLLLEEITSGQSTGHKVEIYLPENFSSPPDKNLVLQKVDEGLQPLIELVYGFLETPIVEDRFGTDDASRDAWEKQIETLYGEEGVNVIRRNRLRPNAFTEAVSVLYALPDYLQRDDLQEFVAAIDPRALEPSVYKKLSREEKGKIVAGIHNAAVGMLSRLAE